MIRGKQLGSGLIAGALQGLDIEWLSTTSFLVTAGSCRDRQDTKSLVLSSPQTVLTTLGHSSSDGLAQLNGVDEKGLDNLTTSPITCSQTGTTITATADVVPHYQPANITGTISAVGTAVTGTGTKFLEEVFPNDLIGTPTTYGWARVVRVNSDTSLTLIAAFPGGDPTGISAQVIYNATILAGTGAANTQPVNTITAAGTTIVGHGVSATVAGGSPLTINGYTTRSGVFLWYAVWLVWDGSNMGILVSGRHDGVFTAAPWVVAARRIGWVRYGDPEDGGAFLWEHYSYGVSPSSKWYAQNYGSFPNGDTTVTPAAGALATNVGQGYYAPRTARCVECLVELSNNVTSGTATVSVFGRGRSDQGQLLRCPAKLLSGDPARIESVVTNIWTDKGAGWLYNFTVGSLLIFRGRGFLDIL